MAHTHHSRPRRKIFDELCARNWSAICASLQPKRDAQMKRKLKMTQEEPSREVTGSPGAPNRGATQAMRQALAALKQWRTGGDAHLVYEACSYLESQLLASQEPPVAGVRAEPLEDAVHGRCAEWLRSFVFKNRRDPLIQEVWDAARPPAAPQQEQTP